MQTLFLFVLSRPRRKTTQEEGKGTFHTGALVGFNGYSGIVRNCSATGYINDVSITKDMLCGCDWSEIID